MVLEYSFGRKSDPKQGLEKILCHVWEYGGKLKLLKNVLTSVPVQNRRVFIIMIDLSKIKTIWSTLQKCVDGINEYIDQTDSRELIIIGGKYDLFKNYGKMSPAFSCIIYFNCCFSSLPQIHFNEFKLLVLTAFCLYQYKDVALESDLVSFC